jgi:hypothetical protein
MTTPERGRVHGASDGPGEVDVCTSTFDALGHRFAVACDNARTAAQIEDAFGVMAVGAPPIGWYSVRHRACSFEVGWMEAPLGTVATRSDALTLLRSHVQRAAIASADADLVLRAGGVELDGRTLVVSGESGCGVSTLLAALVAEGCSYLGDDAIPVELRSGKVRPFPQPLLLDDRSLDLLPEVSALASGVDSTHGRRLVRMRGDRGSSTDTSRAVSVVVFPGLDGSGIAILRPVGGDEAVVRLVENAYNFPGHERDAIEAIDWLVRGARSFAVTGGDPHSSARAVIGQLDLAS